MPALPAGGGEKAEGRGPEGAGPRRLRQLDSSFVGMMQVIEKNKAAVQGHVVVVMARLVDGAGDVVRQSGIDAIEYSIFGYDRCDPHGRRVYCPHDRLALPAGAVIFNSLQTDGLWTVDDAGYNFRHEFDFPASDSRATSDRRLGLEYEITPKFGSRTIVRFQLGVAKNDGRRTDSIHSQPIIGPAE